MPACLSHSNLSVPRFSFLSICLSACMLISLEPVCILVSLPFVCMSACLPALPPPCLCVSGQSLGLRIPMTGRLKQSIPLRWIHCVAVTSVSLIIVSEGKPINSRHHYHHDCCPMPGAKKERRGIIV